MTGLIITIDGPAGAGKGTMARRLAQQLGLAYLDTGTVYRATALTVLNQGGDPADEAAALAAAQNLDFTFQPIGGGDYHGFMNGQDVEADLRRHEVSNGAGAVAAILPVRDALRDFQRQFAQTARQGAGAVLDGRDCGTVICPDADVKFFLTADPMVRAKRRVAQLAEAGKQADLEQIHRDIVARDTSDAVNMKPAPDAIHVDTTSMTPAEVFQTLLDTVTNRPA